MASRLKQIQISVFLVILLLSAFGLPQDEDLERALICRARNKCSAAEILSISEGDPINDTFVIYPTDGEACIGEPLNITCAVKASRGFVISVMFVMNDLEMSTCNCTRGHLPYESLELVATYVIQNVSRSLNQSIFSCIATNPNTSHSRSPLASISPIECPTTVTIPTNELPTSETTRTTYIATINTNTVTTTTMKPKNKLGLTVALPVTLILVAFGLILTIVGAIIYCY